MGLKAKLRSSVIVPLTVCIIITVTLAPLYLGFTYTKHLDDTIDSIVLREKRFLQKLSQNMSKTVSYGLNAPINYVIIGSELVLAHRQGKVAVKKGWNPEENYVSGIAIGSAIALDNDAPISANFSDFVIDSALPNYDQIPGYNETS